MGEILLCCIISLRSSIIIIVVVVVVVVVVIITMIVANIGGIELSWKRMQMDLEDSFSCRDIWRGYIENTVNSFRSEKGFILIDVDINKYIHRY